MEQQISVAELASKLLDEPKLIIFDAGMVFTGKSGGYRQQR